MARIQIPRVNWPTALAQAIKNAGDGDTIVVHSRFTKEIAETAKQRMGRQDLIIEIEKKQPSKN